MAFIKLDGLKKFIQKIHTFVTTGRVTELLIETIEADSADIVRRVQYQLSIGVDGNGEPVYLIRWGGKHLDYAPSTIATRRKKGMPTSPISNYWSGEFYESIYVQVNQDGSFQMQASDWKYDLIRKRSGPNIIQLNPESQVFLFGQEIGPQFKVKVKNAFESEV